MTNNATKTIVFFVSGHGFGHASREVEVINALGRARDSRWRIIIRSAVSPSLLDRTLTTPYELRPGICDTGVIQSNSVTHDDDATVKAAIEFYRSFDAHVANEVDALRDDRVALVVADIAPLGLAVAASISVPSVFIANFTWDWIYEGYAAFREGASDVVDTIRRAHSLATHPLRLPLSPSFDGTGLRGVRDIPLIARRSTRSREDTRQSLGLPLSRRIALLSFGGYGLHELDLARVDCGDAWDLVVTDRSVNDERVRALPFVHVIDENALRATRYEDLVAASDVVMTKPGFGIIGECATAGVPMLYTSRGEFREYNVLVRDMPRYLRCEFISQNDLFAGRWRAALDTVIGLPAPLEALPPTGADAAANVIQSVMPG